MDEFLDGLYMKSHQQICRRFLPTIVSLYLAFFSVFAFPGNAVAQTLEKVSVQFHWLSQFEFAGFYIAKEKGFYSDVGLDVSLLPYVKGKTDVVEAVSSGRVQYGVNYTSLLFDYHKGKPVVALAAIFQDSPLVLLAREGAEIITPKDLKGRNVMIGGDALNSAPIMALLFSNGLMRSDIVRQLHSYDINDLISGHTDAMTAYISNEPFLMEQKGHKYRILDPKESGLSFYEDILFTSRSEAEKHPERARAFLDASLKGWSYAFEHIEETINIIQEKYNQQNKSFESLLYEANALKKLAMKSNIPLGHIGISKLEKVADAYRLMGMKLSEQPLENFLWSGVASNGDRPIAFSRKEQEFAKNTVIKAATTTNWVPLAFVDKATDAPQGIGYEFWQLVKRKASLRDQITRFQSFSDELNSIRKKEQDVIYSVGITEDRKEYANFTAPYATFPLSIATSKDENFIPDPSHLEGKKIAIGRNFTAHKMMAKAFPKLDYVPVNNVQNGLQMVSDGDVYAFVDMMPILSHSINKLGFTNLKISGNTGLVFDLRFMVRNDYPDLVTIANKVISSIRPEQKQEIFNRWINVQYQQGYDFAKFTPYFAAVIIVVSLALFWMYYTKTQAQQANRAKSEFLALMSHDLRTPLNAIMGFSDIMRTQAFGPLGDSRYEEYAADIHKSGSLLVSLINDILDLSKIEAGKYDLDDEEVVISALFHASMSQCSHMAKTSNVSLVDSLPADMPSLIGDERALIQILNNLISNAIKFSHQGDSVKISATISQSGCILISVSDTGIGMTKDAIKKVLAPFVQADKTQSRKYEGTGLGLHLSHSLMKLFSGDLMIKSEVDVGTTVTIGFPSERTIQKS